MFKIRQRRSPPQAVERQWIPVDTGCVQPFERVFVISLARRPDRLEDFWAQGPGEWPWLMPEVFEAVNGNAIEVPGWFRAPPGAWGCLQSHVAIWDMQIKAGWDSVLVLEDDALFCNDAVGRMRNTLDCVPADWDQIYFGGQHWQTSDHPPETEIQDGIVRCRNVNRTHAYAIRLPFAKIARTVVTTPTAEPNGTLHHIDYRLGNLHETGVYNIYAPWRFCIGQRRGESDVAFGRAGRQAHKTEHFWNCFPIVDPVGVA